MKTTMKRSLIAGATIATLGLAAAGVGVASAATSDTASGTSLIDKIATTFNLNRDEVAKVFTADRQAHMAEIEQAQANRLAQAVKDGKLTQAQADHITATQKEIRDLMGTTDPGTQDEATRTSIHNKMDALRTWATDNNIDLQYVGPGGHHGFGGPGGPDGAAPTSTPTSSPSPTPAS